MSEANEFVDETLDACRALQASGQRVNRKTVAVALGISREAASYRLNRLYDLGLWPRNPISGRPTKPGVEDSEAAARINAVRAATRERGRCLSTEEVSQVLGD